MSLVGRSQNEFHILIYLSFMIVRCLYMSSVYLEKDI